MTFVASFASRVLRHPLPVLAVVLALVVGAVTQLDRFRLDASADSLVVEGDPDLAFAREVSARFGTGDFVFITWTPQDSLFTTPMLARLRALRDDLVALERVSSVDSILSVPLFKVAGARLADVADSIVTLDDSSPDLDAVREDLLSNRAYRDVLLSADGRTTALVVNFAANEAREALLARREELREARRLGSLDAAGQAELARVEVAYDEERQAAAAELRRDIRDIRALIARHGEGVEVRMGGVPMIADDLVTYVQRDLLTFGSAMLLFIIAALWLFFRSWRLVLVPLLCGSAIIVVVMGLLGLLAWPVTVISSNFISLLLIISVSLNVHLIVRYRELQLESPGQSHQDRLQAVLQSMFEPCLYTSLTTMVGFASLAVSDIPPVVDFGLMMVLGVGVAFVLSFLLFPALMALFRDLPQPARARSIDITPAIGRFTERHGRGVLATAGILLLASVLGLGLLKVENSFIGYFDEDSEIHQGMVAIDTRMGGTTPLDVIVTMTRPDAGRAGSFAPASGGGDWEDEWDDEWEDESATEAAWFTRDKMQTISRMHAWLDALPETGKVLSLATLLDLAYELNDGRELNSLELGILYRRIPESYRETLLRPYVSVADDQVRFSIRVRESDPDLRRGELIRRIREGLVTEFGLAPEQVRLSGMLVLYNNMLESLYKSQIESLALVLGAIFLMFIVLFRSLYLALLGIIPNVLAATAVLGLMGLAGIPLDMMTITIAAIAIGIGVDNTIHYVHRFRANFPRFGDYLHTLHYCHASIGKAMYYTGFTIVAGFSILVLSNFVPSVYFGLLTSLGMVLALAGSLTLLPLLLVLFRPLGVVTASPGR